MENYNYAVIRELVVAAFDDEDLVIFCSDHFGDVAEQFTTGQNKKARVHLLIEHVKRHGLTGSLLNEIQKANTYQYDKFKSHFTNKSNDRSTEFGNKDFIDGQELKESVNIKSYLIDQYGVEADSLTGKEVCKRLNITPRQLFELVEDVELECKGPSVMFFPTTSEGKLIFPFVLERKRDLKPIDVLDAYFKKEDIEAYEKEAKSQKDEISVESAGIRKLQDLMSENSEKKKVFISYAREDQESARKIYSDLTSRGIDAWLDCEKLHVGHNWKVMIRKAIKESNYFLALLSHNSLTKAGYVQKELKIALEIYDQFSPEDIFILPARLEECKPSDERLEFIHWTDLFSDYEKGLGDILRVLDADGLNETSETGKPVIQQSEDAQTEPETTEPLKEPPEPDPQIRKKQRVKPDPKRKPGIRWKRVILSTLVVCAIAIGAYVFLYDRTELAEPDKTTPAQTETPVEEKPETKQPEVKPESERKLKSTKKLVESELKVETQPVKRIPVDKPVPKIFAESLKKGKSIDLGDGRIMYKVKSGDSFYQICQNIVGSNVMWTG